MKNFIMISLLSFLVFLSGCLTYERISFRVIFDDPGKKLSGKVFVSAIGIASTEDSLPKQKADFEQILEFLEGDDFLLDELKNGIYIKNRTLLKEKGKLVFKYDGIFNELTFDDEDFKINIMSDKIIATLDLDDDIENTNGIIEKDSLHTYIKWPKGSKEIYWEYKLDDADKTYSLLPFYEDWLKN